MSTGTPYGTSLPAATEATCDGRSDLTISLGTEEILTFDLLSMRSLSRLVIAAATGLIVGCASSGTSTSSAPRTDPMLITREQVVTGNYRNAYEAVQALHAPWLISRGTDSFSNPSQVWVYINEVKMGGVAMLKDIAASDIASIRRFDGITASSRWGLDHGSGAIMVSTRVR